MVAKRKKEDEKEVSRDLDMAQHEYRFNKLGLSERVKRVFIKALVLIIPVILIVYWLIKVSK